MILSILEIVIGVVIADLLTGWVRGARKRAHMRKLNKLAQLKRAKRKPVVGSAIATTAQGDRVVV